MLAKDASRSDEAKRARILEAAFEVCVQRGVSRARMEEVAARAQVSKGTLYRFFASKEELLLASIIASYEEGLSIVYEHSPEAQDPLRALDSILEGLVKLLGATTASMMRVFYESWAIVAEQPEYRARLDAFMRDFHADRHREVAQLIRRGQQAGVFRAEVLPEVMGQSIDALLNGFCYWATFDPDAATPDALRAALDTLVRRVLVVDDAALAPGARCAGSE
ncbi:MAG: TetR/AcrR family transcriptional regulator [Myxococcales bacterium]|nr:TetR/AcrR family transcriptional regulator [Myxococcales bacterium]MDH5566407.1 TetR/AcrR family transcriptional regulator [Myxococcales bacterium]